MNKKKKKKKKEKQQRASSKAGVNFRADFGSRGRYKTTQGWDTKENRGAY
jgi:hypothetical protein